MKPFLNKFLNIFHFRRQTAFFAVLGAVFVLTIALFPGFARADAWTSGTQAILGFIFELLFAFLGPLLSAIIASLVDVAKYNNIIGQTTIKTAWTTVRDIVNMFFIFAILLIAFSTILRIRQYEAKQLLPKLVLYAVLVNFSLTICGVFIDIAQIFTLTFVSAFQDSAVNNFANITKMMDYASVQLDGPVGARDILAGYILGTALLVISIVVIGALVLVLLARILFLWVLAILSPFVFVLPIIPGGQKYSSQWWSMFSSYVISGPLLAFFIWLSLTVMSQQKIGSEIISTGSVKIVKTTMGEPTFLLDYVMGMGMLIVGLILTQKLGGLMGTISGGAMNYLQGKVGPSPMRWARERYQSYRGQRESIRKESVQRFGQGVSAIQDRQISSRISGLVRGTAGQVTGAITGGRWVVGETKQRRAQERANIHAEKQVSDRAQTYRRAMNLSINQVPELLQIYRQSRSTRERAAIGLELGNRTTFGRNPADRAEAVDIVNATRQDLGYAPETVQKFDDAIKRRNLLLAVDSSIYNENGDLNTDSFLSDLNEKKFSGSAINQAINNRADAVLGAEGMFLEQIIRTSADPKALEDNLQGIDDGTRRQMIERLQRSIAGGIIDIFDIDREKKVSFSNVSQAHHLVYNRADPNQMDHFEEDILSSDKNRDKFITSTRVETKDQDFYRRIYESPNFEEYALTEEQLKKNLENGRTRGPMRDILAQLVNVHRGDYSNAGNNIREQAVKMHQGNILKDGRNQPIINMGTGRAEMVFELNNPGDLTQFQNAVNRRDIKVEDFKREDLIDPATGLLRVDPAVRDSMYNSISEYSLDELKKISDNSRLMRDYINWMRDPRHGARFSPKLTRMQASDNFVHLF